MVRYIYLFNNKILHEIFYKLSQSSIDIHIVSIPLEGYDSSNIKEIIDVNNYQNKYDFKKTKKI